MPVDFEWEVGEEDGEWSTLATPPVRRRWRPPRWVWCVLLALLLAGGGSTYAVVHRRYEQARQRLIFEIQSIVDLQARAYAQDDRELFLAQIDRSLNWWYAQERHRLSDECRREALPSRECIPFLPGVVEDVEVRGDYALAQVTEEGGTRRARFYRRVGNGWLYAAPRPEFWDTTSETGYKGLVVSAHRRDLPYVYPLLDRIAAAYEQICAPVGCHNKLLTVSVVFSPTDQAPRLEGDMLSIDSPWLVGIPAAENLGSDYLSALETAARSASLEHVFYLSHDDEPNRMQRALMQEYLDWSTSGHLDRSPLLRRLIEQHGTGTLPQIIRSLVNHSSPEALGRAWLALPPEADEHLFQFLLDVEHEALLAGQVETWLLFYDVGEGRPQARPVIEGDWRAMFDTFRDLEDLPPPEVVSVEVSGDRARVVLAPRPGTPADLPPAEFYVRQDERWLHIAPYYALDHELAQSAPPPDPDRTTIRFACNDNERESYQRLAAAFAREHPGVTVEVVSLQEILGQSQDADTFLYRLLFQDADAFLYRLLSQVDAMIAPNTTLLADGWLRDLAPLIAADPGFYPEDVVGLERDGPLWALPTSLSPVMVHYDRAAFDAAGLSYPQPGWTADEFLSTAQALTLHQGEEVSQYGFISLYPGDMAWLQGRVCAGEEELIAPAMIDAVRWNADLSLVHGVMFGPLDLDPSESDAYFLTHAYTQMREGQAAMWAYTVPGWEHSGAGANYGFVSYPEMGCAANPVYVSGYAMSAGTRHPDETWQWLRYLSFQGVPGQFELGRSVSIPARRSLLAEYARLQGWGEQDLAMVRYALEHGAPIDDSFDSLVRATILVLNGRDAEESLGIAPSILSSYGE